jgi:hypothetical protein
MNRLLPKLKISAAQISFFILLLSGMAAAQPTVLGTQLANGGYVTYDLGTIGSFKQYRLQAASSAATGTRNWEFASGTAASTNYNPNWRPFTGGNTLSTNLFIPTSFANGAKYNTGGGASGLLPAITAGSYYTFNVGTNAAADNVMQLLETPYDPVVISGQSNALTAVGSRTISITTAGTPATGENIFVRYTTDGYINSTIVQATGTGTTWTASIPWQAAAVSYYIYTSNKTLAQINSDVTTNGQSVHDMSTLRLLAGTTLPSAGNVIVSSTGGTFATPLGYNTLGLAVGAINGSTAGTGAISILIVGNTTELAASTILNAASTNWTSINIQPSGARTITAATTTGLPMLDFNGADFVTIDGLNTGGNSLTISNTTAGATATSTIRFLADATNNTITNCTILGAGTSAVSGTIFFSTGTATGNDNNTITFNTIGASSATPTTAIYSAGTSTVVDNSGINISNNNIADYFNAGAASIGLNIASNSSAWTVSTNRFYQAATRTSTSAVTHGAIKINSGVNYSITGNIIGYANSGGTLTTFYAGAVASKYIGIEMAVGTATASNLQGNTITNFNLSTTSGTTTTPGIFTGIYVTAGNVNIGNTSPNIIGGATGTNLIFITSSTSGALITGITSTSIGTVNIQNNNIGAFGNSGTGAIGYTFIGIQTSGTAGIYTITGNTIGSTTTANSIAMGVSGTTTTGICSLTGITNAATGATVISNNILRNLTIFNTTATLNTLKGIENTGNAAGLTIAGNTLQGFSAPTSTGSLAFTGITNTGTVTSLVSVTGNNLGNATQGLITYGAANGGTFLGIAVPSIAAAAPLTITTNNFQGIVHSVAGTSPHTYISYTHTASVTDNINGNTFTNLAVNTSGSVTFISRSGTMTGSGTENCNNNSIVTAFNKTGAGGIVTLYTANSGSLSGTAMNQTGNNFSNITVTGATTIAGWINTEGALSGPTKTITGNTFNTWTGGTSAINAMTVGASSGATTVNTNTISGYTNGAAITGITTAGGTQTFSGNTVSNLSTTTGAVVGMQITAGSATNAMSNNIINTLSTSGSGAVTGIVISGGTSTNNLSGNTISGLSTTSTGLINGILTSAGTTNNISGNKIYNLSTTGTGANDLINGIGVSGGTSTNNIYNNVIGDLRAPNGTSLGTDVLRGISFTASTTSTQNVFHNTIYLTGSGGTNFPTSGIFHQAGAAGTSELNLRNNIIINNTTPSGSGAAVALRRSSSTITNYASSSNNNLFYAGTPGANNLVYSDGTGYQTLAAFQAAVGPREAGSQTENTALLFVSTSGASADFLRLPAGAASFAESAAVQITTPNINTDYWGVTRPFPSPVNGGIAPDIGASEFDGVPQVTGCVVPANQATAFVAGTNTSTTIAGSFTAAASAPSGYLVVRSPGALSATPVNGTSYGAGSTLGNGTVIQSGAALSFSAGTLVSNTAYTITIFAYNSGACTPTPTYLTTAPLTATLTTCPNAPTAPVVSSVTTTGATLSWTAPVVGGGAAAITYIVDVTTDAGFAIPITGSPYALATTSQPLTGLTAATVYYYRIRSTNGSCEGVITGSFVTSCNTPNNPSAIVFTNTTATSVTVSFSAAVPAPTSYLVMRGTSATPPTISTATNYTVGTTYSGYKALSTDTSLSVVDNAGLTANTRYYYYIYSRDNTNNCPSAPYSTGISGSTVTCPAAPTLPVNSAITATGFTVSWTAAAGGTAATINYTLEVFSDAAFTTPVGSAYSTGTALTQAVTGLTASTPYFYRIRGNNGCDGAYLTGTVTTGCAATALNISEGFNSATIPACWSKAIVAIQTASKITFVTTATTPTTSPQEGSHMVLYNSFSSAGGSTGSEERLISLPVNTTGISSVDVSFYWRNENNTGLTSLLEGVQVQYSTDNSTWTNLGSFIPRHDGSLAAGTAQWNLKTFTSAAIGNLPVVYIALKFHSEFDDNMMVDNFAIRQTPTPIVITPSSAAVCSGSSTTFTVSSANTNYAYTWSGANLNTTSGATVTATPTTTTTYTVTGVDGAMTTTASIVVTVNPVPANVTLSSSASVCPGVVTALTASSSSSATYQIGSGATASVAANTPYRQAVTSQARMQYLITKAELNAAGITAAGNITSLGFSISAAGSGTIPTYAISMANTALTTLTATFQSPAFTSVYNGTNYIVTTGVNTHTFAAPFAWDGTSNILINICMGGVTGGSSATANVMTPSGFSGSTGGSGGGQCGLTSGGTLTAARPVIFLGANATSPITWTPLTGLYTDPGAAPGTEYAGAAANTVYAKITADQTYTATATLGTCTKTNAVTLTVKTQPGITSATAANNPVCGNDTTTLTANGVVGTNAVVNWYSQTGGVGTNYGTGTTLPNAAAGTYFARVTGDCGPAAEATVTVTSNPGSVAGIVSTDQTICSGSQPANITIGTSTGTIQWQASTDNAAFSNIVGQTGNTLTGTAIGNLIATTYFRAIVTSGVCAPATSGTVTVTVNAAPVAGSISGGGTTCTGNNVLLTLTGSNGAIQWQSSADNVTFADISGANATTYNVTNVTGTTYYQAVVSSGVCTAATTTSVSVVATPAAVAGTITGEGTVCSGTNSTVLTLGASTGTIQWQSSSNNTVFNDIPGANGQTYTATNLTATTYYHAVVTSGGCPSDTSNSVAMLVTAPSVAGAITGGGTTCSGSDIILTLTGSFGTIQWQSSPDDAVFTDISGENGTTYTAANVTGTAYYRAVVTSGICAAATTTSVQVTAGGITTTWNGTAWDNGQPTSSSVAIIAGAYSASTNLTACTLTVNNNAVVSIPSGFNVFLNGKLTVTSGSFTLQNNANLLQNTNVENSGNIIVKRNSSAIRRQDYTLWSSPVENQNLLAFSPLTVVTPTSRFYQYNSTSNAYNSITNPGATAFNDAQGYLIRVANNHPTFPAIWAGQFNGEPNNGPYSYNMSVGAEGFRFNLVGNPYPSPISAVSFTAQNANITKILYFWRETNNNTSNNAYCSWSPAGGGTGTFVTNNQQAAVDPLGVIQTGQGFFVEALEDATAVNFNNTMRVANNANQFFRTAIVASPAEIESHRIWLNVTNATDAFCQTAFGYMTGGTQGFDLGVDGKYINSGDTELYSLIDSDHYVIQGRSLPFVTSDIVPLGFKAAAAGNFTIAIDHVDGLFSSGQDIFLRDNLTGAIQNLTAGAYNFTTEAGAFNARFDVLYENQLSNPRPEVGLNGVLIIKNNGVFTVNSGKATMDILKVYDVRGRLLVEQKGINASETTFTAGEANQVLIVKITSEDNLTVTRKVIN